MPNSAAGSLMSRITLKTEDFWNSRLYFPVMLAVTAISMLTGNVVPSTVLLAALCGWLLVFCRDILAAATPFLMIFLLSTLHYSSLSVFLPLRPCWRFYPCGRSGASAAVESPIVLGRSALPPGRRDQPRYWAVWGRSSKEYFSPLLCIILWAWVRGCWSPICCCDPIWRRRGPMTCCTG